jgi:hypothetical protein
MTQDSPSRLIDARIKELGDWRGEMISTRATPSTESVKKH